MTPVLLDLDLAMGAPGTDVDDGFALALSVADPGIDLRLLTTVSGNTDAATATTLTLELLDRLGDPEAAAVVLQSGVMATWVGLDVTRRVRITRPELLGFAVDVDPAGFAAHFTDCLRRL